MTFLYHGNRFNERVESLVTLVYGIDSKKGGSLMSGYEKFIQHIVEFTEEEVSLFIDEHKNEEYYAFAYDCNPETNGIYLSFNTMGEFERTLDLYQAGSYADLYEEEDYIFRLKYNPGDWKYQNFVYIEFIYEAKIKELFGVEINRKSDDLLKIAQRALLEFKKTEVYKEIPKTQDFIAFCIDHEEDERDAINRSLRQN